MEKPQLRKKVDILLEEIEKGYNERIKTENIESLKAISKIARIYPVIAIADLNPINGKIDTTNQNGNIRIEYNHKSKACLFTVTYANDGLVLKPAAQENFYCALNDYDMIITKNNG